MPTITFHSFANGKSPCAAVAPYATTDVIVRAVKKSRRLAFKGIDAEYNEPRKGHAKADTGIVYAGGRAVARFTITEGEQL